MDKKIEEKKKNLKYSLESLFLHELKNIYEIDIEEDGDITRYGFTTGIILIDIDLILNRIDYTDQGILYAIPTYQFLKYMDKVFCNDL